MIENRLTLLKNSLRLAGLFGFYVGMIFGFPLWYYSLYKRHPDRYFIFDEGVQTSQRKSFKSDTEQRVDTLKRLIAALRALATTSQQKISFHTSEGSTEIQIPLKYRFVFRWANPVPGPGTGPGFEGWGPELTVVDPAGSTIIEHENLRRLGLLPSSFDRARTILRQLGAESEKEFEVRTHALAGLETTSLQVGEWTYWDFVYFSTVSQTTVGYGDILPKSTVIRKIVILQIMAGLICAVFVLSLLTSGGYDTEEARISTKILMQLIGRVLALSDKTQKNCDPEGPPSLSP